MKTFEESLSQSSKQLVKDRLAVSDREMYFYEMGYMDAWEVTHADYRALEDDSASHLRALDLVVKELSQLKGKVREFVEAYAEFAKSVKCFDLISNAKTKEAMNDAKDRLSEAMEALQ